MAINDSGGGKQRMTALKSLLLRAWRERWSDMQWSVQVKRHLNIPVNNDDFLLAELLLGQGMIGPNALVLSYLNHAMHTQMLSYNAVIQSLVTYDDISRVYCVKALLDLVAEMAPRISTRGMTEDPIQLAKATLSLVKWLLIVTQKTLSKLSEEEKTEVVPLVEKASSALYKIVTDPSTMALLSIVRHEDPSLFKEVEKLELDVRVSLPVMQCPPLTPEIKTNLEEGVTLSQKTQQISQECQPLLNVSSQPLNASINVLVNIEAVLRPTNGVTPIAEQLLIIESTQGLSRPELYCEIIRSCFLGMINASGGTEELKWAAFTFLKIPQVIVKLVHTQGGTEADMSRDLEEGFQKLLNYVVLLDRADTKCQADCLQYMLHELSNKHGLFSEVQCKTYINRRKQESLSPFKGPEQGQQQPSAGLIKRAEPTVISILKTLDADYSKNQEALLGILIHMMSGKSFELILAAAAATGKVQTFATKLIKFNEESGRSVELTKTRSSLFDISFLMLCHITQSYGTEIVCSSLENSDSFFVQWVLRCLPEGGRYKSTELMPPGDPAKLEVLIKQFQPGGADKPGLPRWHDVCHNAPRAVQEILWAWELGLYNLDQVKTIVSNIKNKLCSLPIVVCVWLCSHMNILDEKSRAKPLQFIQLLAQPAQETEKDYVERSHLMQIILKKIIQDILPANQRTPLPFEIPNDMPIYTMLGQTFRDVFRKGATDIQNTQKMEHLMNLSGSQWFCEYLIREVLSHERPEDLSKGCGLAYAFFHLDLENLTICLLHHTLPGLLTGSGSKVMLLSDPKGRHLTQFTIMCLLALRKTKQLKEGVPMKRGRKRTRADMELEEQDIFENDLPATKRRPMSTTEDSVGSWVDDFSDVWTPGVKEENEITFPAYNTRDPLNRALANLFRLMNLVLTGPVVNQKTGFVLSFIEEIVKSGNENSKFMLQFMPFSMVSHIVKLNPNDFNAKVLFALCDLTNQANRKAAANIICQSARFNKMSNMNT